MHDSSASVVAERRQTAIPDGVVQSTHEGRRLRVIHARGRPHLAQRCDLARGQQQGERVVLSVQHVPAVLALAGHVADVPAAMPQDRQIPTQLGPGGVGVLGQVSHPQQPTDRHPSAVPVGQADQDPDQPFHRLQLIASSCSRHDRPPALVDDVESGTLTASAATHSSGSRMVVTAARAWSSSWTLPG